MPQKHIDIGKIRLVFVTRFEAYFLNLNTIVVLE